ncbi:hypothetical protein [Pseudomonas chlororaphis]|uniref:hypothetical protein n=1 Tax=Pseudomonas chlororaphis TaxID=587753 RepID=UPI0023650B79|nr:hypothetical protein [Pseudomonas chlororaphis]WDH21146.1 hypothetical protein PUP50_24545 [Pseudomonas chlororaphis]
MNKNIFSVFLLRWLVWTVTVLACFFYAAYLFQAIYLERGLYADGSNFFVELLSQNKPWPIADDPKHIRLFANMINQFPIAVALQFGVENLRILKLLFGAGLFLGPILVYFFCFWLSWRAKDYRVFIFSVASLVTCAIPSDIFILNQSFISLALAWVLIHYLLLRMDFRWFDWLVITFISLMLFRAHENLVLWGGSAFIGAAAIIRFGVGTGGFGKNRHIYLLGLVGLAQALFVIYWQLSHSVGQETNAFLALIDFAMPQEMWIGNTRISLLTAALLVVAVFYGIGYRSASKWNGVLSLFVFLMFLSLSGFALYSGFAAIQDFTLTDPRREFNYRFLMTFGSAGWMLVAIVFVLVKVKVDVRGGYLTVAALSVGLLSASMWQVSNNLQWLEFKDAVLYELRTSSDAILQPESVRQRLALDDREYAYKYRWAWTWPVFGMSLQKDGQVVKIFKPEGFDQYFKPPKTIPFVPLAGGDYGSEGKGLYSFDGFKQAGKTDQ